VEGKFGTYRTCGLCAEIRSLFFLQRLDLRRDVGRNEEQAFERLTTASPCFIELSAAAKEFVLQMWREWKFDV